MTKEDKELLLKDLCARLSYYGLICQTDKGKGTLISVECSFGEALVYVDFGYPQAEEFDLNEDDTVKPYLRPMSSITEEEFKDLKSYSGLIYDQLELQEFFNNSKCLEFYLTEIPSYIVILVFDWLNAHHFDYRGLIERGLALEAPEDMYKI